MSLKLPKWAQKTRQCSRCGNRYLSIKSHCPVCKVRNVSRGNY